MTKTGAQFFDDPQVFETYWGRRGNEANPNALIEEPLFQEVLGDVAGLRVLDVGCGDARFGSQLLAAGAREYVGLDGALKMVEVARERLQGVEHASVVHGTVEELEAEAEQFDVVISRLVLHYVDDLGATLTKLHRVLKPGGRIVFSVEHPVLTSCHESLTQSGRRGSWIVDDYFLPGARTVEWMGGTVTKYHRTVEDYFLLLQQSGFHIEALREPRPVRERFPSEDEFTRRTRIPLFLLLAGRKQPAR